MLSKSISLTWVSTDAASSLSSARLACWVWALLWRVPGLFTKASLWDGGWKSRWGALKAGDGMRAVRTWQDRAHLLWQDNVMSFGPWHLTPTSVTALLPAERMRAQETTGLSSVTREHIYHSKNRGSHVFVSCRAGAGECQFPKWGPGRTEMELLRGPKFSWYALESGYNSPHPCFSEP